MYAQGGATILGRSDGDGEIGRNRQRRALEGRAYALALWAVSTWLAERLRDIFINRRCQERLQAPYPLWSFSRMALLRQVG